jgi:putative endopeptidase
MKTSWTPIRYTAITLALCGAFAASAFAAEQTNAPARQQADAAPANATLRPGDDFFAWANGGWLAKTDIPADRSSWGAMASLAEETNQRIVKLIEDAGKDKSANSEARKVGDYYAWPRSSRSWTRSPRSRTRPASCARWARPCVPTSTR